MDEQPLKIRLTSRRFLITLLVSVLVVVGEKIGITLDEQQLLTLAAVVGAYNLKDLGKPPGS